MDSSALKARIDDLLEQLAAIEHQRWAHWQRYMHGKGYEQPDGSILFPTDLIKRWQRQIDTPYAELTEEEKESDRDQVRRYLPIIKNILLDD